MKQYYPHCYGEYSEDELDKDQYGIEDMMFEFQDESSLQMGTIRGHAALYGAAPANGFLSA